MVLLLLYVTYSIRRALLIVIISILFAYLLYPLVDLISRRLPSKTRTPALLITYAIVIAFISIFSVVVGSVVAEQATNLAQKAPQFVDRMKEKSTEGEKPQQAKSWKDQIMTAAQSQVQQHYNEIVSVVPRLTHACALRVDEPDLSS